MKEYTVQQLAALAGVSVRTLHWYHAQGLLAPAHITPAGYRIYKEAQVNRLQDILFYRVLQVPLKDIAALLDSPSYDRLGALQAHRGKLKQQRAQLDVLLKTLEKTIETQQGENLMNDNEKFEGLRKQQIAQNEAQYGAEIRKTYGNEAIDASNAKWMHLTQAQYTAMEALGQEVITALEAAVKAGEDPKGLTGQAIAAKHKDWLAYTWPKYTKQAHAGLAQMYLADERFTAFYDKGTHGCAQFLCDAIAAFTQ